MLNVDDLFKGRHFDREIIVLCVRWYLRYKLSFRDLVEMMAERRLSLAHTTIMRWIQRYAPEFESAGTALLARWASPGASTKPTSKSRVTGPISIVPSTTLSELTLPASLAVVGSGDEQPVPIFQ